MGKIKMSKIEKSRRLHVLNDEPSGLNQKNLTVDDYLKDHRENVEL